MGMIKTVLIAIFLIVSSSTYAGSDRIERPKTFPFIFQNGDTVILNNPNSSFLRLIMIVVFDTKRS
jgi:hypothetical protein